MYACCCSLEYAADSVWQKGISHVCCAIKMLKTYCWASQLLIALLDICYSPIILIASSILRWWWWWWWKKTSSKSRSFGWKCIFTAQWNYIQSKGRNCFLKHTTEGKKLYAVVTMNTHTEFMLGDTRLFTFQVKYMNISSYCISKKNTSSFKQY